jgi:hypothetical protein
MAAFSAEHPFHIRVRRALPGMCHSSACQLVPQSFLHFGVTTGACDLVRREQQSGAVPKSGRCLRELKRSAPLPVTQEAAVFLEVGVALLPDLIWVDQCGAGGLGNASRSGEGRSPAAVGHPD